jgi:hypothetical protein
MQEKEQKLHAAESFSQVPHLAEVEWQHGLMSGKVCDHTWPQETTDLDHYPSNPSAAQSGGGTDGRLPPGGPGLPESCCRTVLMTGNIPRREVAS